MAALSRRVEEMAARDEEREEEMSLAVERERAALAWAEVVRLISQTHASDEEYEAARAQFGEEELVKLTMAVIAINGWNRLAIAFRTEAGKYQPRAKAE